MLKCYKNIKLINSDGCITSGLVFTRGNIICKVVKFSNSESEIIPSQYQNEKIEFIDCYGSLMLPGLINMHTHSAMTFLRGLADDKSLENWLEEDVFPNEAKLTVEDQFWFAKLAMIEYLQSGTTCIFDMYLDNEAIAHAANQMQFRTVICGSVNDYGGSVAELKSDIVKYGGHNNSQNSLVSFRLGFHAIYTTSKKLLMEIASLANELAEPVWAHICETTTEVQNCLKENELYPFVYLNKLKMFKYGGGGFHCVHLSEGDRKVIKKRKLTVVTCPSSNLKLSSGIIKLKELIESKVNICVGTDGPASNNALSIQKEMYLTSLLAKNEAKDPKIAKPHQILKYVTKNSAKALNLNIGRIKKGFLADFTFISQNAPNFLLNDPLKNFIYSSDTKNILMTVIDGEIRYDNRNYANQHILPNGETVEEIYGECIKRSKRIFG